MRSGVAAMILAALVALAGMASAQQAAPPADTATPAPAAEPQAEATDAAPAADAAAGDAGQPQQPQLVTETYGDWELRCTADKSNCFMYQLARDSNLNPVSEISIVDLPDGSEAAAGVTAVTPLGTLLSEGLVLQVDQGEARRYAYNWCTRSGCFARFGLTADEINQLKRGSKARMRLVSVSNPEQPVVLDLSLTGFTAAHNALVEASKN